MPLEWSETQHVTIAGCSISRSLIVGVDFSADGHYLAVGHGLGVDVWSLETGALSTTHNTYNGPSRILSLLWCFEYPRLVTIHEGGLVHVLTFNEDKTPANGFHHSGPSYPSAHAAFLHKDLLAVSMGKIVELRHFQIGLFKMLTRAHRFIVGTVSLYRTRMVLHYPGSSPNYSLLNAGLSHGCEYLEIFHAPSSDDVWADKNILLVTDRNEGKFKLLSLGSVEPSRTFTPRNRSSQATEPVSSARFLSGDMIIGAGVGQIIVWNIEVEIHNRLQNLVFRDTSGLITQSLCAAYNPDQDLGWIATSHNFLERSEIVLWKTREYKDIMTIPHRRNIWSPWPWNMFFMVVPIVLAAYAWRYIAPRADRSPVRVQRSTTTRMPLKELKARRFIIPNSSFADVSKYTLEQAEASTKKMSRRNYVVEGDIDPQNAAIERSGVLVAFWSGTAVMFHRTTQLNLWPSKNPGNCDADYYHSLWSGPPTQRSTPAQLFPTSSQFEYEQPSLDPPIPSPLMTANEHDRQDSFSDSLIPSTRLEQAPLATLDVSSQYLSVDFGLAANGAKVLLALTSHTQGLEDISLLQGINALIRGFDKRQRHINPPGVVLEDHLSVSNCWRFAGSQGHIAIAFSEVVIWQHIVIHFPYHGLSETMLKQAPKFLLLWALISKEGIQDETHDLVSGWERFVTWNHSLDPSKFNSSMAFLEVAKISYDPSAGMQQKFTTQFAVQTSIVVVEVLDNWGNPSTCLHRISFHGDQVSF
ncbi:hypothetical protein GG344DRAFT_70780 [Lentinula edodes]|nr:hypothetical protein GG344DRAFT_70780 [Lentinula edodes]